MRRSSPKLTTAVLFGCALALGVAGQASAAVTPKRGGILNFVVGSKIPSYDLHKETTFGVIHPIAPFYSLLIRINPENPQSATDFVCDLCEGSVPKPTNGGKTFTFKIQKGVKFHNGRPLTAKDVLATYQKIIFPPEGVPSARKAFFKMVSSVTSPDEYTVIFNLQFPSGAFIPALATPFNIVMSKEMIDQHGMSWYAKNIMGSGPFMFVDHQPGSFVSGKRFDDYHHKGQPYLDGYKAISAPKMAVRLNAIRGNRAAIEFRGFPPKARDDLVNALGDGCTEIAGAEGPLDRGALYTLARPDLAAGGAAGAGRGDRREPDLRAVRRDPGPVRERPQLPKPRRPARHVVGVRRRCPPQARRRRPDPLPLHRGVIEE